MFLVYVVLCLIVFGCQHQCNWLPGKTRLRNDLFPQNHCQAGQNLVFVGVGVSPAVWRRQKPQTRFLLLWPWPWPDDLDIRVWPKYWNVPLCTKTELSWSTLSKVRAWTGQTDGRTDGRTDGGTRLKRISTPRSRGPGGNYFGLALHLQHARDCNLCPSPHARLPPSPLVMRSHVYCTTPPDTPWRISTRLQLQQPQRPVKQASRQRDRVYSNFK